MSSNNNNSSSRSIVSTICYILLAIIILLTLLTVFNMDLFLSYFSNMGQSMSFGAFIARLGDFVIALLQHTFGLR